MRNFSPDIDSLSKLFPNISHLSYLSRGGQKLVFKGIERHGEQVALKLIPFESASEVARMSREPEAISRLTGPNFAKIYTTGEIDISDYYFIYFVEEFIEGKPLREILNDRQVTWELIKAVGQGILTALEQVEKANLVHRDIKPENIMVGQSGRIVLLDFGIARHLDKDSLTADGVWPGPMTLGYCAPEQILNEKRTISIRTDFFALGVVLYEMATCSNPFINGYSNTRDIAEACLGYDPPTLESLKLPASLSKFVSSCMNKSAHKRPSSVARARVLFEAIHWR